ncbi:MAG: ATP-binding cassette domain-containing protein [Streptococcus parasanguinis]
MIGSSGAGKSTFLRKLKLSGSSQIAVELRLMISEVDFEQRLPKIEILTLRRKLAMVFQQFNLFGRRTALENVKEGFIVVKGSIRPRSNENCSRRTSKSRFVGS